MQQQQPKQPQALPTFAAEVVPVSEDPHPSGQWKKCVDGTPNCGLLHDLMSIEWGKFRDGFDELTAEMNQNKEEFDTTMRNSRSSAMKRPSTWKFWQTRSPASMLTRRR